MHHHSPDARNSSNITALYNTNVGGATFAKLDGVHQALFAHNTNIDADAVRILLQSAYQSLESDVTNGIVPRDVAEEIRAEPATSLEQIREVARRAAQKLGKYGASATSIFLQIVEILIEMN